MGKLDALRKIIREEVRTVFKEELAEILKESIISKREAPISESIKPAKPRVPGTLNTAAPRLVPPVLAPTNPLSSLLAETAQTMSPEEMGYIAGSGYEANVNTVETVDEMFATARKSSNLEAIEINAVPDFSEMMAKMNL